MSRKLLLVLTAATLPLGACATTPSNRTLTYAGTGAAVGAAGGAGIAALTGGDILTGASIGGAVGGVGGAVWADHDHDGRVDGYTQNGTYYPGVPAGYSPTAASRNCPSIPGSALTGAAVGGAAGAGVGALADTSVLGSALVGAAVGGLAGAVWADSNNDGCVDGYMREGRYYPGAPVVQPVPSNYRAGERG